MKKVSIVVLMLVLALVFTSCANNELELYNAFKKSQDISSMESNTVFNITVEGEGFPVEEQQAIEQITSMLTNSEVSIYQKMIQNEDKTAATAFAEMNLDFGGMVMPLSVWVDTDLSSEAPKLVEIIKLPQLLMTPMSPESPTKEYIVYDFEELMDETEEEMDFNQLMEFSEEMQLKMISFFENYQENFNPEIEIMEHKEKRDIDGEVLSIYELKLDDESFKDLVRDIVDYTLENEETIEFLKEYMNLIVDIAEVPDEEKQLAKDEINSELDNLEESLPEFKEQFNEFMDAAEDIQIIGDEGIVIEYGINSDGYIAYEAGDIDLVIDLENIQKFMGENTESDLQPVQGRFNLGISYNTKIKNINGDIEIDIPKVNEDNSINLIEMMEDSVIEIEEVQTEEPAQETIISE